MVHSIVPLAVLEAIRNLDTPVEDGLAEFADELLSKRLGMSATIAMQVNEYEGLVRRDATVDPTNVEALLRLVGRRPDADLVFADAGRRAARRAAARTAGAARWIAHAGPRGLGYAVARRAARVVLSGDLHRDHELPVARMTEPLAIRATPDGAACGLYGAAFTELLRLFANFEGSMVHVSCRGAGGAACEWRAAAPDPRHH
ncbi:MAG TPA: hypothetical protein VFD85_12445 [Gemmatimonadales bacterium]|nr:hypothetical protein [Gemmatimonadales bacterium]